MAAQLGPFAIPGYYVGDCRELLRQLPDGCINCCVTSPPYWGLRDYGEPGQLGLEPTPAEYVANMLEVFREVRRVLRDDGTLWLNLGDCYATGAGKVGDCPGGGEQGARWRGDVDRLRDDKRGYRGERLANGRKDQAAVLRVKTRGLRDGPHCGKHTAISAMGPMTQPNRMPLPGLKPKDLVGIPWRVAFALQVDGWWLRSDLIWSKPNPMPESVTDRPTKSHEYLFLLSKSEQYQYDYAAVLEEAVGETKHDLTGQGYSAPGQTEQGGNRGKNEESPDRRRAGFNARWDRKEAEIRAGRKDLPGPTYERHRASVPGGQDLRATPSAFRNRRTVWTVATEPTPEAHFAVMPTKLVQPCILAGCPAGGVVLDPFGGSGTTARVAEDNGRQWLLFDLSAKYAEIAKRKTAQTGLLGRVDHAG